MLMLKRLYLSAYSTALLIPLLFIQGCVSTDQRQKDRSHFNTRIYPDSTKNFTFTLSIKDYDIRDVKRAKGERYTGNKSVNMSEGRKGGRQANKKRSLDKTSIEDLKMITKEKLLDELAQNAFCRNRYIELDSYFYNGFGMIKGKCQENATREDWKKFHNDPRLIDQLILQENTTDSDNNIESIPLYL